jgi:hypothetical protein
MLTLQSGTFREPHFTDRNGRVEGIENLDVFSLAELERDLDVMQAEFALATAFVRARIERRLARIEAQAGVQRGDVR